MQQSPKSETIATLARDLLPALDLVDFGLALLSPDMHLRFNNTRFAELWQLPPEFLATAPTFEAIVARVAGLLRYELSEVEQAAYLASRITEIRRGSVPPQQIYFKDGRRFLFRCDVCPDGGRILTYCDITAPLRSGADEAIERISADLRFNNETLETQAAHLATLAEAADEYAQKAEAARQLLEQEIAERRELELQLRRMATTDHLTGSLNRAAFMAVGARELGRNGHCLSILMLDIDHFKAINDRHGHAGGDHALQHLVTLLRSGIRQIDALGRLGGEEFAILLPDTPRADAARVAERLRALVAEARLPEGARQIVMTVSIGVAGQTDSDTLIETVIARADSALYKAKHAGRNRVVVYRAPADRQSQSAMS